MRMHYATELALASNIKQVEQNARARLARKSKERQAVVSAEACSNRVRKAENRKMEHGSKHQFHT